jgi:hypothetical protein
LWGFGAYQWLWLPESSLVFLLLGLVWGLAQLLVVVGILAATATSATAAAATNAHRMGWRDFLGVDRRQFSRCLILAVAGSFLVLALLQVFSWSDDYALEVASFLTFRSERAVSPIAACRRGIPSELPDGPAAGGLAGSGAAGCARSRQLLLESFVPDQPAQSRRLRRPWVSVGDLASQGCGGVLGLHTDARSLGRGVVAPRGWLAFLDALAGAIQPSVERGHVFLNSPLAELRL